MTSEHDHGTHRSDTLLLDIGGDIGALTIFTGPDRDELELEISPVGTNPDHRIHNVVHARQIGEKTVYAAVFPNVPAGDYTIWRDAATPDGTVVIHGGKVTDYKLGND